MNAWRAVDALLLFGVMFGCFATHVMTDPKKRISLPMPPAVRWSFWMIGLVSLARGIHLGVLAFNPDEPDRLAKAAFVASWALFANHFILGALETWKVRLPPQVWAQLRAAVPPMMLGLKESGER